MTEDTPLLGGWWRRHWLKTIASLAVGALFVWILEEGNLPLIPARAAFAEVEWWAVGVYVVGWWLVHVLRAARWYWLLAAVDVVPLRRVLSVGFVGFAAILLFPFRTGEVVRPVLIRQAGKLSGWAATGTVAAERIMDGLCLSVIMLLALSLARTLDPLPDHIGDLAVPVAVVPTAAKLAVALFAVAFVTMAVFYLFRSSARRVTEKVLGIFSVRLARWVAERIEQVAAGLQFLPRARFTVPFVLATLAYWSLNVAGAWLLAWASGFDSITLAQAAVVTGVLALFILPPSAPGFFGTFQVAIYAGFAMFFPAELIQGPGAAYVFIIYVSQVSITVLSAAFALLIDRTPLQDALAAPQAPNAEAPTQ